MKNAELKAGSPRPLPASSPIRILFILHSAFCILHCGCISHFGTGGTGEIVIADPRLHEVHTLDLQPATRPATAEPTSQPNTQAATRPTSLPATRPAAQVPISIEQCRQWALQNNLDLRVDLLNPTIARENLSEEEARFESLFTGGIDFSSINSPNVTQTVPGSGGGVFTVTGAKGTQSSADAGLVVPLQTGGSINLSLPFSKSNFGGPVYSLSPALSINQPLLRNGWFDANAHPIRIAFYEYQISQALTKLEVIRVLADMERAYWRLYAAREELAVRKKEYDLAAAQLDRARRQARIGTGSEPDVVRAESGVADTLDAIITAENAVRDTQRDLKRILNAPGLEMNSPTVLVPATKPDATLYQLDSDRLVRAATEQRMEMLETELRIAEEVSNVRLARNDMLPLVSLGYTYKVNGLGAVAEDAWSMVTRDDFKDHTLSLNVQVPLGNEAARSRLRRALASRIQQLATQQQRALQIQQEVLAAIDSLAANWQRILAARTRVIAAARVVDVETRQFNLGLRTSTDVLDAQNRLASAQSSEIAALTDYQIAQVDLAFATGTLLGASRVHWEPAPTPKP